MRLERWRPCWFRVRVNHAFQINPVRFGPLLSAMPVKRVAPIVNSQERKRVRSRICLDFRYTVSITSWLRSSLKSGPQPCERKKDTSCGVNTRNTSVKDSSFGDSRKSSVTRSSRRGRSLAIFELIMPNSAPHGLQFHKGDVRPNRLARAPYMRSSQADLIGSAVSGPLHIFSRHAKKYGLGLLPETAEMADSNFTCDRRVRCTTQNM